MDNNGVICSSCGAGESSYTDSTSGHSVYTKYLLQGLDNNIHYAEDLHNYAKPLTTAQRSSMTPKMRDNYDGKLLIGYTLKDTLLNDEAWYRSLTLKGNVVVPGTTMLTIKNDVDINLSTYSITTFGGAITLESNANVSPYICLKNGSTIKGLYPTFSSALSAANSGETIEFAETMTLSENLSLPSGVTLKVCNGGEINLGLYTITGKVEVESQGKLNPNICVESSFVHRYFPNISSAVSYISNPWDKLILNGEYILSQDLTIQNYNLELGPKSDLNMNGHNIIIDWIEGGSLSGLHSNAKFTPDLRLMFGTTILGFYGSLPAAFSDGSVVELRDVLTVSGNLSVPSGKTLKTLSNSVLKFNSGVNLNISGNLLSNSTSFTKTSGTWGGIHFQSGSSGIVNYCWIDNCTHGINVSNASPTIQDNIIANTTYAIRAVSGSNPLITGNFIFENSYGIYISGANAAIQNNVIEDCSYGLYLSSASPNIDSCTVSDCSTYGLYVYNSSPDLNTNRISNSRVYLNNCGYASVFTDNLISGQTHGSGQAIYMYNSSPHFYYNTINVEDVLGIEVSGGNPIFGGSAAYGYNILDNDPYNDGILWAWDNAYVVLGYGAEDTGPYTAAYNTIYGGYSPLAALGNSSIDATHCYWGQYPAPACYGNVNTWAELLTDPGGGSSLGKSAVPNLFAGDKPKVSTADSLFNAALDLINKEEHASALSILDEIIHRFQDSPYAYKALYTSLRLCADHKTADGIDLLDDLQRSVDDPDLRSFALSQKVSQLRGKGNISVAIAVSEEILSNSEEGSYGLTSLFDLFNMYHKDLGNKEMALFYFNELKARYPESTLTLIARSDMGEDVSKIKLAKRMLPEELLPEQETILPQAFALHQAYPNPFNPSTCIRVELPESGELVLDILDICGRVMDHMLMNKSAGMHEIPYAPKQLSTGIYFIRARFKDQIQMQKIMYLK